MDCIKVGKLIYTIRKEMGLTQKQLAEKMNISDKTISKWERGLGCPDISLLNELSNILGIKVEQILKGDLFPKCPDTGNMRKVKIYICESCNNIIVSTSGADICCCGRKISALKLNTNDQFHSACITDVDNELYVKIEHPMQKNHYISFAVLIAFDRVTIIKLYAEQDSAFRLPYASFNKLYFYCTQHGLFEIKK